MQGVAMRNFICGAALAVCISSSAAYAAETITYTYDAKGRLVKVVHTGTVNNTIQTTYTHDKADNRKNTTTTGAPN
jgi:hypothetical protein